MGPGLATQPDVDVQSSTVTTTGDTGGGGDAMTGERTVWRDRANGRQVSLTPYSRRPSTSVTGLNSWSISDHWTSNTVGTANPPGGVQINSLARCNCAPRAISPAVSPSPV